ncbi:MAG: SpoIIE family protein phosphatase [Bacteroidetes bacterium]|nr:SpoIIE family protein phosphatase [Bacteroidota bacterium]
MLELALQEQILEKLNTLIVVLNTDGSVEYVSSAVSRMLGFRPEQLLGDNWWTKTRVNEPEAYKIKRVLMGHISAGRQTTHIFENELRTAQGGRKWIRWSVSFLNDEQIVGIGYDITDKKQAEQRLLKAYTDLENKNKDITDSIFYAQRIQESILPSSGFLKERGVDSFVLYKPKDIVSGDYYWFYELDNKLYVAAVDCTGHGVPGAMMSMVANSILKEVFINKRLTDVAEILAQLDMELSGTINQKDSLENNDGMDIGLVSLDKTTGTIEFAGAFRPMLISRKDGSILEVSGSRYPIGFYSGISKKFDKQVIQAEAGDNIYLFTDGYVDQFGGQHNKKLNRRNFKDLIQSMNGMTPGEQEAFLEYAFNNWKQDNEQTDDILVIGLHID